MSIKKTVELRKFRIVEFYVNLFWRILSCIFINHNIADRLILFNNSLQNENLLHHTIITDNKMFQGIFFSFIVSLRLIANYIP